MSFSPDESANTSNLKDARLTVTKGSLKSTRGGSFSRGNRGSGPYSKRARTPARLSGLGRESTVESEFAVVIESAPPDSFEDFRHLQGGDFNIERSSLSAQKHRGRPPKNHQEAFPLASLLPRRIGRPSKHASRGMHISSVSAKRKLGRPRNSLQPQSKGKQQRPSPGLVSPNFFAFLCEWKDCKAELHNLETLRRHIYTVHNKPELPGDIICQWGKCGIQEQQRDNNMHERKNVLKRYDFNSTETFKEHTEKTHLIPLAWHMGDGPRGSTLDGNESDRSAYLVDPLDRQITPPLNREPALRYAQQMMPFDPSLQSRDRLVTPAIQAGFGQSGGPPRKRVQYLKRTVSPD